MSETTEGIKKAEVGTPKLYKSFAVQFIREYAQTNLYFDGGQVLKAWRRTDSPIAQLDWRNRWGAMISLAHRMGVMIKVGRINPKSKQSHTTSLVLWESNIYRGTDERVPTARKFIADLKKQCFCRELSTFDALWKAYEFGFEDKSMKVTKKFI